MLAALEADGRHEYDYYRYESHRPGMVQFQLATLGVLSAGGTPEGLHGVAIGCVAGPSAPTDPNAAVEHTVGWLSSAADDPTGVRRKLAAHAGPERHAFVWVDLHGPDISLRPLLEGLPTDVPELPAPVTDLWIVGGGVGARWSAEHGWRQITGHHYAAKATRHWFRDRNRRHRPPS